MNRTVCQMLNMDIVVKAMHSWLTPMKVTGQE